MRCAGRYLGKLPSDQNGHCGITSSPSPQFWPILTSAVFRYVPDMCITLIFCPLQITHGVHAFWSNEHESDMGNKYIDKNVTVPFARSLPYSTHCPARSLRCILSAPFSAFTSPCPGISWHVIASEKPSLFVLCSRSTPYTTLLYFLHSSQDYGYCHVYVCLFTSLVCLTHQLVSSRKKGPCLVHQCIPNSSNSTWYAHTSKSSINICWINEWMNKWIYI